MQIIDSVPVTSHYEDTVTCLECGAKKRQLSHRHLVACSGLTAQQYLERHPGATLVTEQLRLKLGSPLEKNPRWKGGLSKKKCKDCKKALSPNNRTSFCVSCVKKGNRNPFHGKTHSVETRTRMATSASKRDISTYKYGLCSSELNSAIKKAAWACLTPNQRREKVASFIHAGLKANKKSSLTKIERLVAEVLASLGVNFSTNVWVGKFNVDLLVQGNLVIECFGDYWHCNPSIFSPTDYNRSLHMKAQERWGKDLARIQVLTSMGYKPLVFWESDIKLDLQKVKRIIISAL